MFIVSYIIEQNVKVPRDQLRSPQSLIRFEDAPVASACLTRTIRNRHLVSSSYINVDHKVEKIVF